MLHTNSFLALLYGDDIQVQPIFTQHPALELQRGFHNHVV